MRINPPRALAKAGQSPALRSAGEEGWGTWLETGEGIGCCVERQGCLETIALQASQLSLALVLGGLF